jgi:hypothetical protein
MPVPRDGLYSQGTAQHPAHCIQHRILHSFLPVLCVLLFFSQSAYPQLTKIMGHVTDAQTKEPIPFVNILLPGTIYGTLTDFDGRYALEVTKPGDSIEARLLGYKTIMRKIVKGQFQTIDFELTQQNLNLPEVVIRYTGNPAEVILDKIIKNKDKNTLQAFDTYQYEAYTKIQLDANNISDKLRNRKLFKPFEFIWNYVDTSTINGKSYLPVFLTETMSDVYYRKSPRSKKEIIKASQISGLENESVSQFLGNLSQEVDVYKNYIPLFEKNFVSPIADFGLDYYKYYLVDSSFIDNKWCYHIMFKPRRRQELTFTGSLWVNDTSFAIKKIEMRIASDANINFVNDLASLQEYTWTDNKYWLLSKDNLVVDFNIINNARKLVGFFGHRTTLYRNFKFDVPETQKFFSLPTNVIINPDADAKNGKYWDTIRPEPLSASERGIYTMVDSVKNIPIFKTYTDIIYGIVTGYLTWGNWELGPYFKIFSYNAIEGARFRVGARTGNGFSKKIQLEGYVAYGTYDLTYKFGADMIYMFRKNPRRDITAGFKYDVEQLGQSPNAFATDNILSSLFHRGPNNKLTMVREYKVAYEHEWFNGLINTIRLSHREMFPLGSTEFIINPLNPLTVDSMKSIFTSDIGLDTRISFHEKFVSGEFYRFTISSSYPIILISYNYGFPNVFRSDYEYHKLSINLQQWFNFATIGWSKYMIEAGKIWGTLPYNLLRIHDGNQTFLFDEYASNLMNYYEFVSDAYISAYYTHHFDGLLFNKIPLLRKLKWREVGYVRAVYGTLTHKNAVYSKFPDQLRSFATIPYWEAGAGIENIFRFIRVDAIWRFTHLHDDPYEKPSPFGVFISMNFSF